MRTTHSVCFEVPTCADGSVLLRETRHLNNPGLKSQMYLWPGLMHHENSVRSQFSSALRKPPAPSWLLPPANGCQPPRSPRALALKLPRRPTYEIESMLKTHAETLIGMLLSTDVHSCPKRGRLCAPVVTVHQWLALSVSSLQADPDLGR
ncbi:hypothetical protein OH77DRAFT_592173 [Trametes cingulata]|nr:hypothetical protein OH77DRAFT_592173 [Trametes cingulata]